jgi:hypothetical protein
VLWHCRTSDESLSEQNKCGLYGQLAAFCQERSSTPAPYSNLRKVSEVTEPESGPKEGRQRTSQDEGVASEPLYGGHTVAIGVPRGGSTRSPNLAPPPPAMLRDRGPRLASRAHPLSHVTVPPTVEEAVLGAPSNISSEAVHDAGEGGYAAFVSVDLSSPEPDRGASMRASTVGSLRRAIFGVCSGRPRTDLDEDVELQSLRRGPKARHARLPLSPTAAINAGLPVPESTKELWAGIKRSRDLILVSAALLILSLISVASSITAVSVSHDDGKPIVRGLLTWVTLSGVFLVASAGLMGLGFWLRHKSYVLSRPLPNQPGADQDSKPSNAEDPEASTDYKTVYNSIELLKARIDNLIDTPIQGRQIVPSLATSLESGTSHTELRKGRAVEMPVCSGLVPNKPQSSNDGSFDKTAWVGGSIAPRGSFPDDSKGKKPMYPVSPYYRRHASKPFFARSDEVDLVPAESANQNSDRPGSIAKSSTKASILTELCEAVTEE